MSTATTEIAWTDRTWNPVRGCSIVSSGCINCYAAKQAHRFSGPGKPYEGLTKPTARSGPQWTGKVVTVESALLEPLSWRKPQRVFVNSMSDLFHEDVPFEFIDRVVAVMALAPRHTFQILTKRADRMLEYFTAPMGFSLSRRGRVIGVAWEMLGHRPLHKYRHEGITKRPWPLPNVWLGFSAEDQLRFDERWMHMRPLAVQGWLTWCSGEPLLGPICIDNTMEPNASAAKWLRWLVVGGESGAGARPFDLAWARSIVQQCQAAGVACFVKQLGADVRTASGSDFYEGTHAIGDFNDGVGFRHAVRLRDRKGGDMAEWPEDLRVREFPDAAVRA